MIPRIIHQTWKTTETPVEYHETIESCKRFHQDYVYKLWTDDEMDEFVKTHFPEQYTMYINYPHDIQRCDAFRYMVLYFYGGFYLDLDIGCKFSFEALLDFDLVLTQSYNYPSITNSFMACCPQQSLMKLCIDQLHEKQSSFERLGKHLHVHHSTGPFFLQNAYIVK